MPTTQYIEVAQRKYDNTVAPKTLSLNPGKTVKAKTRSALASATRVTTVATVILPNHGFLVGDSVVITGVAPFAKTATIASIPDSDTFTYAVTNSGAPSATIKALLTILTQNFDRGLGAQPVDMQVAGTLAALQALFPPASSVLLNVLGDETFASLLDIANAIPTIWPLKSLISFEGVNGTSIAATNTVRASSTVTVTAVGHGLVVGQWIVVSNASNSALNGTYQVATVADADTFTYTTTTSGTIASGTATITPQTSLLWVYEQGAVSKKYFVYEAYAYIQSLLTA